MTVKHFVFLLGTIYFFTARLVFANLSPLTVASSQPGSLLLNHSDVAKVKKFFAYRPGEFFDGVDPRTAKVVVVFYTSPTCPHCKDTYLESVPELKRAYAGKSVSIITRSFVMDVRSLLVLMALQCKVHTKESYHKIMLSIYATQHKWALDPNYQKDLTDIFLAHGYTKEEFLMCINNNKIRDKLLSERVVAVTDGELKGVPYVGINGVPVNDFSTKGLKKEIDRALL